MEDRLKRRDLLRYTGGGISLSVGASQIKSVAAENPDKTPPGLYKRPYQFVEFTIETESVPDGATLGRAASSLPNFGIGSSVEHRPEFTHEDSPKDRQPVYIPEAPNEGIALDNQSPIIATHEGIKHPSDGAVKFSTIPTEANSAGSFTAIHNSEGVSTSVGQNGGGIQIRFEDSVLDLPDPGKDQVSTQHYVDVVDQEASLRLSAKYHGRREIIWHDSGVVVPINEGTEKMMAQTGPNVSPTVKKGPDGNKDVFIISRGN